MHRGITGHGSEDQNGQCYKIKSYEDRMHHNHDQGTCDSHPHISKGPPQKWVQKGNKQLSDNRLSEPIDRFAKIQNDELFNKMEMERNDGDR